MSYSCSSRLVFSHGDTWQVLSVVLLNQPAVVNDAAAELGVYNCRYTTVTPKTTYKTGKSTNRKTVSRPRQCWNNSKTDDDDDDDDYDMWELIEKLPDDQLLFLWQILERRKLLQRRADVLVFLGPTIEATSSHVDYCTTQLELRLSLAKLNATLASQEQEYDRLTQAARQLKTSQQQQLNNRPALWILQRCRMVEQRMHDLQQQCITVQAFLDGLESAVQTTGLLQAMKRATSTLRVLRSSSSVSCNVSIEQDAEDAVDDFIEEQDRVQGSMGCDVWDFSHARPAIAGRCFSHCPARKSFAKHRSTNAGIRR
jgi:hypothetical protein